MAKKGKNKKRNNYKSYAYVSAYEKASHTFVRCPYCHSVLSLEKIILARDGATSVQIPVFDCSKCKHQFIYSDHYRNMSLVKLNDSKTYINLSPDANPYDEGNKSNLREPHINDAEHHKNGRKIAELRADKSHKRSCYVCKGDCPDYCCKESCNEVRLKKTGVHLIIADKTYRVAQCPECGTIYIKAGLYELHPEVFDYLGNAVRTFHKKEKNNEEVDRILERLKELRSVDVIVKGNTFQCVHKNHHIENIKAQVPVIDKNGNIKELTVNAGYCRNCNTYFIREGTYQFLKAHGVIACRVKEEDVYYAKKHGDQYGNLAQESILMEYGYNVSSSRNLSDAARRRILSILIDDHIVRKSRILDYLQFFINQRRNQKKNYREAIEKWNNDSWFVLTYETGKTRTVKVRSISHKKHK